MNTKYGAVIIEVKKPIEVKKSEQEDPVIEEVLFQFIMPMGIPYGTAYDAVHDVLREINAMVEEATQRAVSMKKENSPEDKDKATSA
jgi:hypothetical protein